MDFKTNLGLCDQHIALANLDPAAKLELRRRVASTDVHKFIPSRSDGFVSDSSREIFGQVIKGKFWEIPDHVNNVCEFCLCALKIPVPHYLLADAIECGICGVQNFEGYDFGLLFAYERLGLSADFIYRNLPRYRTSWTRNESFLGIIEHARSLRGGIFAGPESHKDSEE